MNFCTSHKYKNLLIRRTTARGFTLIELMVSVSIFVVVLLLTIGAVLSILDTNRKAQSVSSVMDNLNGTLESMTRTIKTNSEYVVDGDGYGVSILKDDGSSSGVRVRYDFVDVGGKGSIVYSDTSGTSVQVTAPEVDIDTFKVIKLIPTGICNQPKLLISVVGTAGYDIKTRSVFAVQSIVSQRDFLIPTSCFTTI